MRRGIGNYVRTGYQGASGATRRFGGTAQTANALFGALSGGTQGGNVTGTAPVDLQQLKGQSAQQIINAVVEAVRPIDGTQDAEASRAAIGEALSELLKQSPTVDLTGLTPEQIGNVIESYVALDVYRRVELDLGKHIQAKAPSAKAFLSRLKIIKSYIKQTVSSAFKKLKAAGQQLTTGKVNAVVRGALSETFSVFEGYAQ
jgi:hypothetical protein